MAMNIINKSDIVVVCAPVELTVVVVAACVVTSSDFAFTAATTGVSTQSYCGHGARMQFFGAATHFVFAGQSAVPVLHSSSNPVNRAVI
jgi:hypothetical protein